MNWIKFGKPWNSAASECLDSDVLDVIDNKALIQFGMTHADAVATLVGDELKVWIKDYYIWLNCEPVYITASIGLIIDKKKTGSFVDSGLNKPGTLIELDDGTQYLIGDINTVGGVCDDCIAVEPETIIKRYAIVYES